MKIIRLRMQNYRRYVDTTIELGDGVTALVGRNGSGKTTILEAIAFALYGTHAVRTNKALIRHDGAAPGDAVRVELDVEVAGQAVAIIRELRGVNQTGYASLTIDGQTIVPPQAGSSDAVTEEVTQRIGLEREAFFTTVFARQKELSRLADKSKADRKKLVLGMLGIDALDAAIQEARSKRRESEARVTALRERAPDMEALEKEATALKQDLAAAQQRADDATKAWHAAQQALEAASTQLEQCRQAHETRKGLEEALQRVGLQLRHAQQDQQRLQREHADAAAAAQEVTSLRGDAQRLPEARQQLQAGIEAQAQERRINDLQAQLERLQAEHDALQVPAAPNGALNEGEQALVTIRKRHDDARQQLATITAQARTIQDRRRRSAQLGDDADCPVCERPMGGHADRLREHLEAEANEQARLQAEADDAASGLAAALEQQERQVATLREQRQAHLNAQQAQQQAAQRVAHAKGTLAEARAAAPATPTDVAALQAEVTRLEEIHSAYTRAATLAERLQPLQEQLAENQTQMAALAKDTSAINEQIDKARDTAGPLATAQQHHAEVLAKERTAERGDADARQQVAVLTRSHEDMQRRQAEAKAATLALQAAVTDHRYWEVLGGTRGAGLLERFRNHLVGRIGPAIGREASRLMDRFTGGRYTEVVLDDFEIYVTDGGIRYELDRFSGGEADLVHLAIRLAVSRLLLERSGAEIRFLALDEVFGSLDEGRRNLVLDALQELGNLYGQVLLVTHHEGLRDALDHTLLVTEDDGEATVRGHND